MFSAALMSRSCRVRQDGHDQCLVFKLRSESRYPHAEQVLLEGYQRSITIRRRPCLAALYSSWRRNSPQPASWIDLFSPALAAAPFGERPGATPRANCQNPGVPAKERGRFWHYIPYANIPYANAAVA